MLKYRNFINKNYNLPDTATKIKITESFIISGSGRDDEKDVVRMKSSLGLSKFLERNYHLAVNDRTNILNNASTVIENRTLNFTPTVRF